MSLKPSESIWSKMMGRRKHGTALPAPELGHRREPDEILVFRCTADGNIRQGNVAFGIRHGRVADGQPLQPLTSIFHFNDDFQSLWAGLQRGQIWEGAVRAQGGERGGDYSSTLLLIPEIVGDQMEGVFGLAIPMQGAATTIPASGGWIAAPSGRLALAFGWLALLAIAAWAVGGGGFGSGLILLTGVTSCFTLWWWLVRDISAPALRLEQDLLRVAVRGGMWTESAKGIRSEDWRRLDLAARAAIGRTRHNGEIDLATAQEQERVLLREMQSLNTALETEVHHMLNDIAQYATQLSAGAKSLAETAIDLGSMAVQVDSAVNTTMENVVTVANATEELDAASAEIAKRISDTSKLAEEARQQADLSSQRVVGLTESTHRIGGMVATISGIAGQTRMLALNATIEANRAGEAGRGFAVVAEEVKSLARQTHDGIDSINHQAQIVDTTTRDVVTTVDTVTGAIREIAGISAEIASAAEQQRQANREIILSINQAANQTHLVQDITKQITSQIANTELSSRRFREFASVVHTDLDALRRRLQVILRSVKGVDRRALPRISVGRPFTGAFGGATVKGYTGDLSVGGALLVVASADQPVSQQGWVTLDGIERLEARIVATDNSGWHAHFTNVSANAQEQLHQAIERGIKKDQPLLERAIRIATKAERVLEDAVQNRQITLADLLDTRRTIVPDTDPPQFTTKHTALVEGLFPQICEPEMAVPGTLVCLISDRNCYVAVHNQKWSLPQHPNERDWNAVWSRNRQVYDDRTAIMAARTEKPVVQTYIRNVGDGTYLVMKEVDAPIMVQNQRWGTLRLALKME